jgi:hypothetical protein
MQKMENFVLYHYFERIIFFSSANSLLLDKMLMVVLIMILINGKLFEEIILIYLTLLIILLILEILGFDVIQLYEVKVYIIPMLVIKYNNVADNELFGTSDIFFIDIHMMIIS